MTSRREFTARTKTRAFAKAGGCCERCGVKLATGKAAPEYHHKVTAEDGGGNGLENCEVLCRACHAHQTHKVEAPAKAEGRRKMMKHHGEKKSRFPLPGGRGSRLKRKIGGEVVRRDEE